VRTAVFEALGKFPKDEAVYSSLVNALHNDSSYAVETAAAKGLGKSGAAQAVDVLQAEALMKPEMRVMQATLSAFGGNQKPESSGNPAGASPARCIGLSLALVLFRAPQRHSYNARSWIRGAASVLPE